MLKALLAASAALVTTLPVAALAQAYTVSYSAFFAAPSDAITTTATITLDDGSFYGNGEYLITGITGSRGGQAITGLADPFSGIFVPAKRPDSSYSFNSFVDAFGFTFTAGGVDYQVYRGSTDTSFYHEFASNGVGRLIAPSAFTVTPLASAPVPEPAAWTLMIAGFGVAGAALRVRRRRIALAA